MAVQAKFYVAQVTKRPPNRMGGYAEPIPIGDVVLQASGGKGNEEWASATPSGRFEMTVRTGALDWFEARLGKDVMILIDDAPAPDVEGAPGTP